MALLHYELGEHLWMNGQLHEVTEQARTRWGSEAYRVQPADGGRPRWHTPRAEGSLAKVIDQPSIRAFTHGFYQRVRADETLWPLFEARVQDDWDAHLDRMVHFWSAVLLAAPGFTGNPMQKHRELDDASSEHFDRWLLLFEQALRETYAPPLVQHVLERARRIADRLSGAMFGRALSTSR